MFLCLRVYSLRVYKVCISFLLMTCVFANALFHVKIYFVLPFPKLISNFDITLQYIKGGPVVGFVYWAPEYHFLVFFNRLRLQE